MRLFVHPLGRAAIGAILALVGVVQIAATELVVGIAMVVVGVALVVRGLFDWRRGPRPTGGA